MGTYIEIQESMIWAADVLKRWTGITDKELAAIIDKSSSYGCPLIAYRVDKRLSDGNGHVIAKCIPCTSRGNYYMERLANNDISYDFTGIAFVLSDIIEHEKQNPNLLYDVISCLDDDAWATAPLPNVNSPSPSMTVDTSGLEAQLAEALKQVDSLQQQNKLLNKQDQELRAEPAAAKEVQPAIASPLTPQQKAAIVRGEKTLNAWKPAIAAMIKVAVRCGEEGPKLRQRPDFNLMFNELDATLSGEQEKFFRESMPDEHIDRLGDARGKADPPDNV